MFKAVNPTYPTTPAPGPVQPPCDGDDDDDRQRPRRPSTKTAGLSTPAQQSDIFISSSTPVSVTIVDKNDKNTTTNTDSQDRDIIYGSSDQGQFEENTPDQVQNELPPRGDLSQYQAEQSDQFYHELPRSRYTNGPNRQPQAYNVYSKSRGEPTEGPYNAQDTAEFVEIDDAKDRSFTNDRDGASGKQQQQGRLAFDRSDDQNTNGRYTSDTNKNGQYTGNVRERVIAVTPAPATYTPTETVNHRRIVVAKPVDLVQEVVEPDNSTTTTTNKQRGNYRANYSDERGEQGNDRYQSDGFDSNSDSAQYNSNGSERYQNGNDDFNRNGSDDFNGEYRNVNSNYDQNSNYNGKYPNENTNFDRNSDYNGQYRTENTDSNRNANKKADYKVRNSNEYSDVNYARNASDQQSKNAKYENSVSPTTSGTGVYISTTPSSASQRIIYVQPVSQEFASQKAVPPKKQ